MDWKPNSEVVGCGFVFDGDGAVDLDSGAVIVSKEDASGIGALGMGSFQSQPMVAVVEISL